LKTAVIGGGIAGLSTAWALSRHGVEVTLFEQGSLPNPLGSSHDTHRLIREAYGSEIGYTQLTREAIGAWNRLWLDLGTSYYINTGTLALATEDTGWAHDSRRILRQLGWEHSVLRQGEVRDRFPWLQCDDVTWALWLDTGGVLLADAILGALTSLLANSGVELLSGTEVQSVEFKTGSVHSSRGSRQFDAVVIAAGPWTSQLRAGLNDRITPSRQVVTYARPPERWRTCWEEGPMLLDVGSEGFYAVPPVAGTGLKIGDHSFSLRGHPSSPREASEAESRAVFETARERFVDFDDYTMEHSKVCFYTVEPKERFILDRHERVWGIAGLSGHGFKFGPVLGEGIAAGVLGKRNADDLADWAAGVVI